MNEQGVAGIGRWVPRGGGIACTLVGLSASVALVLPAAAAAQRQDRPPTPEPNTATQVSPPRPCTLEGNDPHERALYEAQGATAPDYERYPGACERLRFSYGPIVAEPGTNDVLIGPVTIEKPNRDGYITRFKPNLVRADGTVPPVEHIHLHHGTWLSYPNYGSGLPFFAAGEEKTVAPFPRGYGLPIKASDTWLLLHMVHSAISQPMETFITYDVDFVPQDKAEELGLKPAYPIWLDVRPSSYPVFNVQRDYGGADGQCRWPKEECASFDPFGKPFIGQGQPGNGQGTDWKFPEAGRSLGKAGRFNGGTLIGIGGHLHPGGIQDEVDLMRPGQTIPVLKTVRVKKRTKNGRTKWVKRKRWRQKPVDGVRIFTSEAKYWSNEDKSKMGGPPNSWDFSMTVTGLPRWGVHVKPGDALRINAVYDTRHQSTYENMGISVALFVPNDENGNPQAPGIDPFKVRRDGSDGCKSGGLMAKKGGPILCERGVVTHGHMSENANKGGPRGEWDARSGMATSGVEIADFLYTPGDMSTISMTGVPTVKLGTKLRFTDWEGPFIYHTVTSCAFPCLGQTGAAFPLADGETSKGRRVDFDSSELGIGSPEIGPARQDLNWELPVTRENGYQPGEVVTYFCRIHPGMRGAFEVTE